MPDEDNEIQVQREEPLVLTERQKWLCSHLDTLNRIETFCRFSAPSDLFTGALYLTQSSVKSANPDWMAQAAHSLREIMYGVGQIKNPPSRFISILRILFRRDGNTKTRRERIEDILKIYQEEKKAAELAQIFNDLHFIFTNIAHHFQDTVKRDDVRKKMIRVGFSNQDKLLTIGDAEFDKLIDLLENAWTQSIPRQLTIHKKIDSLLSGEPGNSKKEFLDVILAFNPDARQYFFAQADERWVDWLWDNGFLDTIKKKSEDPTRYGYRTPEVNYLVRVSEKAPIKVTDIVLAVPVSKDTFNPEVVDRFLWICSILPAEQLSRLAKKIRDENWVSLLGVFNRWGFEYEKILKTLSDAKDYENILVIAEAILSLRTDKDAGKITNAFGTDKPFYIEDLSHTKVFEHLLAVPAEYEERVLKLTTGVLARIVSLSKEEDDKPFSIGDLYYLFDVDFFALQPGAGRHLSDRDDIRELAAVIVAMLHKLIGNKCKEKDYVRTIYEKYIGDFDNLEANIPDSRAMWRLRLLALSLCPAAFADKLKKTFFRLFDAKDHYHDIVSGAEYNKALQKAFPAFSESDKRQYVDSVFELFEKIAKQDKEDEKWHKIYESRILSMIESELSETEKQKATSLGLTLDPTYKPESSIGQMRSGTVIPQAPGTDNDWKKSVPEIIELLKTDWAPAALKEKYKDADFLRPIDAEGVAEHLKAEMSLRPSEFISNAQLFFDRKSIDAHYTYAFFQNLYTLIRERKISSDVNISPALEAMKSFAESATMQPFEQSTSEERRGFGWLANWDAVHSAMADTLKEILGDNSDKPSIDFKASREVILKLIAYLLDHPDPGLKDEELETAKFKTKSGGEAEYSIGDPFTTAINSVRGRAFQALINFAYRDSRLIPKEQKVKLSDDVKELYVKVLDKENTRAIIFLFGHYLPSLYFWDKAWVRTLLPQIFPTAPEKKYLYLSSWEGYLANNLFEEMFFDPEIQNLYERGILLKEPEDPKRKHFKDPDEGLAVHLALAFMYYKDFGFDHPLFKPFWENAPKRHSQFVSFLGRAFVSGDNKQANKLLKEDPRANNRLKEFWDWTLTKFSDIDLFAEFGFWINLEKNLFETPWLANHVKSTLEKTKGFLDWDYGLTKSLIQLAKEAPADTLAIANLYLLEGGVRNLKPRMLIHIDNEWLAALQALYNNPATKDETYTLIDNLIREGGSNFWSLKKILEN